ncbi:MAG TPA: hypothetical protein VM536_20890, partial [Chloroflexia bacterium]|nr:hypothetical protein [Chloroflexia bacterium]
GDTAHHLAVGHQILATGAVPLTDTFSHAHVGGTFIDWEWLAEAVFAGMDLLLGLNGVGLLSASLIAGTLYGLCRWMMARGLHPVPALLIGLLAAVTSEIHWLARPHLFSFALLLGVLYLLEEVRAGRAAIRRLAAIPPLLALWANLHAGFVTGLLVCGAYLAGALIELGIAYRRAGRAGLAQEARPAAHVRAFGLTLGAATLATLLNPYGAGLHLHIFEFVRHPLLTRITVEFLPPDFRQPITWAFLVMLAGMGALLIAVRGRIAAAHALLLLAWTIFSLQAARNIFQFSILVPGLLAPQVVQLLNRARGLLGRYRTPAGLRQGRPVLFVGTLAVMLLVATFSGRDGRGPGLRARWTSPPFPLGAVAWLQTDPAAPHGKMFNTMTWGGYLLTTLYPAHQIFVDSQQDVYGEALTRDYLTIESLAPGWDTLLDRHGVTWVIEPVGSPLVAALRARPDQWAELYTDPAAAILSRR